MLGVYFKNCGHQHENHPFVVDELVIGNVTGKGRRQHMVSGVDHQKAGKHEKDVGYGHYTLL